MSSRLAFHAYVGSLELHESLSKALQWEPPALGQYLRSNLAPVVHGNPMPIVFIFCSSASLLPRGSELYHTTFTITLVSLRNYIQSKLFFTKNKITLHQVESHIQGRIAVSRVCLIMAGESLTLFLDSTAIVAPVLHPSYCIQHRGGVTIVISTLPSNSTATLAPIIHPSY